MYGVKVNPDSGPALQKALTDRSYPGTFSEYNDIVSGNLYWGHQIVDDHDEIPHGFTVVEVSYIPHNVMLFVETIAQILGVDAHAYES